MTNTSSYNMLKISKLCVAGLVAVSLGACGKDDPVALPPVPVVKSVSPTIVVPGDTVTITGSDFATPRGDNRVYFNNPLRAAIPFSGSATSLRVVVPPDAASGAVRVTVPEQPQAGIGPAVAVSRGIGDVWVFGGTGDGYPLRLPFPSQTAEYLMIPHAANSKLGYAQPKNFTITADDAPEEFSAASPPGSGESQVAPQMTVRERFDQRIRRDLDELIAVSDESALAGGRGRGPRQTPGAPAQTRQFSVLNTVNASTILTSSYTRVTTQLRYDGQHCLIYSDVDTLATGNFTQSDFNDFGQTFDDTIYPADTLYFGRESDIDNNGKVIVVVSGIINALPGTDPEWDGSYFIGGFFLPIDLFRAGQSGVQEGTTNEAEVVYLLASDPNGDYLSGLKLSREFAASENLQTLAHEFEHLISFSFRFFSYGLSTAQQTWLEEGMAHMAEDLVGRNDANIARAGKYLRVPGAVSLEHDGAPIEQRGGIYLFLRYLGDRFGEGIYRSLLQSRCVGRPCIEAITGENFYDTVADFLAALHLSGRGITDDERYNFRSIDLDDFQALLVRNWTVGSPRLTGEVVRTSGSFYLFTNPGAGDGEFIFTGESGMGLRTVIVRTR